MNNEIKLLKNNDHREWSDLEWIDEFYNFLQGEVPDGIVPSKGNTIKLSPKRAYFIIWYLQEHFPLLPDRIEKCSVCNSLYDSGSSGYYSEYKGKHFCDSCYPYDMAEKDQEKAEKGIKPKY